MSNIKIYSLLVVFFSLLTIPWLDKGLISLDARGILFSAENAINDGLYKPSRPPGHPSYELYVLYPIGSIYKWFTNAPLNSLLYNTIQYLFSLSCCLWFYRILLEIKKSKLLAILGSFALMLSPSFYKNSIDGDEFNQALIGFLIAFFFLVKCLKNEQHSIRKSILISSISLALATGFRQEFIITFLIFPIFFTIHPKYRFNDYFKWVPFQLVCGILVWLPVLFQNGFQVPTPMPIPDNDALRSFNYKILVGSYKILFKGFTPAVLLFFLIAIWKYKKTIINSFKKTQLDTFILSTTILIGLTFLFLFYSYPYKADFLHPVFPLLIICFMCYTNKYWAKSLVILSAFSFIVSIEIAHGRKIGMPYISHGHGVSVIMEKTYYKKENLLTLINKVPNGKNVFIADLRSWELQYLANNNLVPLARSENNPNTWRVNSQLLLIKDSSLVEKKKQLKDIVDQGYRIYIEKELFHTFFYRYETSKILQESETYNGIEYKLL
tara:strand:- start:5752 stop:7236 length:1485 start_codon:yes stop_codon:yes gene_type:complete